METRCLERGLLVPAICVLRNHCQAHQEGGGGGGTGILPQGPQTFKGLHEAFIFTFVGCIFTLFPFFFLLSRHCLDSMSHGNFGPGNFGPPDQNFAGKYGPPL